MALAQNIGIISGAQIGVVPCEGAKVLPYQADFAANTQYDFDFSSQFQNGQISSLQAVYVDNQLNTANLIFTIQGTNQRLVFPKQSCGYVPLLLPTPPKLSVSSVGAFSVGLAFMNFYVPGVVWACP